MHPEGTDKRNDRSHPHAPPDQLPTPPQRTDINKNRTRHEAVSSIDDNQSISTLYTNAGTPPLTRNTVSLQHSPLKIQGHLRGRHQ
ncbi:Hypothetical predicted protein [Pelobates cultripes]|uniref:Uncharacterized protein n=1 Tax=Pelobates cultripes TaxID=61616 RepID=A0AAD1TGT7_PELCU|nr:Hypothetical predicted protein [Pelobates cultripes]